MIRDRGKIKWTAMMLPEHVKLLRDWVKEDTYEQKKELDEQQLERINEIAAGAMEFNEWVHITHYRNRNYEILIGKIHYWDAITQTFHVVDKFDELHRISLNSIADIRFG
ncbi:YolD-like family protein [Bacillota bacterium Lsc_1132]